MRTLSSLRARLVGTVFLAVAPAWTVTFLLVRKSAADSALFWTIVSGGVGLLALGAAWFSGQRFVLRQVRLLCQAAKRLAGGDFSARTGLSGEPGELGELARTFDSMAHSLEERARERETSEQLLLARSLQQTVVGALGQFAFVSNDFPALLDQAVMLVSQTLEVEYCCVLELQPNGLDLLLRAGTGWRSGSVGQESFPVDPRFQSGFTLTAGEPVVVGDLDEEARFRPCPLLVEHGVVSGVTVAINGPDLAFGILGAHTTKRRRFTEDEVHFLLAVANVLAMAVSRKYAQAELAKLASFAQLSPNPVMELAGDGSPTYFNNAALALAASVGLNHPGGILPSNIASITQTCLETGQSRIDLETHLGGRTFSWFFHPVPASQVVHAYIEDITDRLSLEAQLRQAQKMESVGQLAAGVAHDFNNMLTIIQGHSGLLLAKAVQNAELMESTQAIYFAAERAANLTRQLLMFSRKNVMQPKPVDLREVVGQMSKMLRRLLGETILLEFQAPAELPPVLADLGMVEQVIMNLAVNARDAMPDGGTLTIATTPVTLSDSYACTHPEARAGCFVALRVSDTGCGMDAHTLARIFEPFFTTKEVGKGTGLGLATVYGIVKQHEGWVEVTSQVGQGSSFTVLFPAFGQPIDILNCAPAIGLNAPAPASAPEIKVEETRLVSADGATVLADLWANSDCASAALPNHGGSSEALTSSNEIAVDLGVQIPREQDAPAQSSADNGVGVRLEMGAESQPSSALRAGIEPPLAPLAEVPGGQETILVVEDEPVLRDMAHLILQDCGYRILEAASGREALEIWRRHHQEIDLVLTDIVMPEGVSGVELAHHLLQAKPDLKLIFASGYSMDELDPAFVREGHALFLQKPYTHISLAKAVRDSLDGCGIARRG